MTEDTGDLVQELLADSMMKGPGCSACKWLEGRADAADWDAAFAHPLITSTALQRRMNDLGYRGKASPVAAHRREKHRVA